MRPVARRLCLFLMVCGVVFAGLTGFGQGQTYRPVTEALAANPDPGDWIHFRRTYDHQGYSPLTQINRQNVGQLQMVWSWKSHPGAMEGTPQVHDGIMFLANPNGGVQAFNAANGDLLWDFQTPLQRPGAKPNYGLDPNRNADEARAGGIGNAGGPSRPVRNVALWGDKVYVGTSELHGGRLVALDARTGKVVWETPTAPPLKPGGPATAGNHSAGPIVVKGKVMMGSTGCEEYTNRNPPCWIGAWDAETGKEVWRTSTIQMPGDPGPDTWGGLPAILRAGSDNWQAGSFDPKTNLTYWGTAQAKPWARFQRGTDGDALYTTSTLALDADTGKMAWYYQHIPGESFDMEETYERVLVDYDGKSSSFSMGKIGIMWELDRRTGAYRAAHDLGYQDQGNINPKSGQLIYPADRIPQRDVPMAFCPGTTGVKSWKAMAYSPETRAFYIPLFPHCQGRAFIMPNYKPEEGSGGTGGGRLGSDYYHPKSPEHLGDFVAMDVNGKVLWRHRTRMPPASSSITTAGGWVVVGDLDRWVRFYDVKSGKILYETRLPSPVSGSPSTYMVNGRQYVAMVVGTGSGGQWVTIPRRLAPEIGMQPYGEWMTGVVVFALPQTGR